MANINAVIYNEKKKHPIVKFFVVLLIIILIIPLILVALAYILLYDSGSKAVWYDDSMTSEVYMDKFGKNIVAGSVATTKDDGKMSLTLTEDNLNTMLHYMLGKNLPSPANEYITSAYFDVGTNTYKFYVNAETPFFPYFKTRVCLEAKVYSLPEPDKGFELRFNNAKVGKIGGLLDLADKFVTASTVEGLFSNTGLSLKVDWSKHSITYNLEDMLKDFGLDVSSSEENIFTDMITDLIKNKSDKVTLDFFTKKGVSIDVDLASAHKEGFTPVTTFANTITSVRNEFEKTEDLEADVVSDKFLEVAKENGEKPVASKDIQTALEDNKNEVTKSTFVTEEEFNGFLRGTDLIGTVYPLIGYDFVTKANVINFIVINDFCADIKADNKVQFMINVSINGYDTQMTIDASIADKIKMNAQNELALDFTLEDINYGGIMSLWDSEKDEPKSIITDMIKEGFSTDGSSSDIDVSGKTISVVIDDPMYDIGNEISTTEDQMNVQIFMPKFYHGTVAPALYPDFEVLKEGDYYFDETSMDLYGYNGSVWILKGNILSNPDLYDLVSSYIDIPLP